MGYLNNVTGYRDDLLANRAIVKHGNYALLTPDGLVKNIIPGFENCDVTILSTPKLGASFVDYLVTLHQNGGNQQGFGGEGIETFLYVIRRGDLFKITVIRCDLTESVVIQGDRRKRLSR